MPRLTPALLLLLPLTLVGCPMRCKPTVEDLARHEVRRLGYWQGRLDVPLGERIFPAPPELLAYLRMDNEVNDFDARPTSADLTPALLGDVKATLETLPEPLRRKVSERLLGVAVVRGLGSSAYTDFVRDEGGRPSAAFVVLDVDAMSRTANEWLGWKESSPFLADPAWRIAGTLEPPETNTVRGALEFVLIHELGHVIAIDDEVHPIWSLAPRVVDPDDYDFLSTSWTVAGERFERKVDAQAKPPGPIVYYKPSVERPSAASALAYYDWLAQTDFVTLYAATSPFDDFADSLATYVHTVLRKKPFEIRIYENDVLMRTVSACWEEPRCAAKRRTLEDYLGD